MCKPIATALFFIKQYTENKREVEIITELWS